MKRIKRVFVSPDGLRPEVFCGAIGALGLTLVVLGLVTVWSTGWGKDLFVPGATLMTVALTAWVAARSVVKWTEQRTRDRETSEYKHREEVYEQLATYMLNRFLGRLREDDEATKRASMKLDAELRTKAALWGSASTVQTLAYWQATLSMVLDNHGLAGGGRTETTEAESLFLKDAMGRALMAMREDLAPVTGQSRVTRDTLLKSIFND